MKVPLSCTAELGAYLAPLTRYSIDFVENSFVCAHPWVSFRPCTPHWNFLLIFNIFSRSCIWTQIQFVTSMYDHMVYYFHIPAKLLPSFHNRNIWNLEWDWKPIFIFRKNIFLTLCISSTLVSLFSLSSGSTCDVYLLWLYTRQPFWIYYYYWLKSNRHRLRRILCICVSSWKWPSFLNELHRASL